MGMTHDQILGMAGLSEKALRYIYHVLMRGDDGFGRIWCQVCLARDGRHREGCVVRELPEWMTKKEEEDRHDNDHP